MAAAAAPEMPFVPIYRAAYVEQHSRPSIGFRLILAIPHLILVYFGGIVTIFVAIAGWFAAVVTGRIPSRISRFLEQFLRYASRVYAYMYLISDQYPPFKLEGAAYPVDIELAPGPLNRLAVLFRSILVIPALLLNSLAAGGWSVCAFVIWLVVLITGRMPRALFEASVAVLRYGMRVFAYWLMLTSAYPGGLFGDRAETPVATQPELPPPSEVPAPPEAAPPPPPIPATEVAAPVVEERPSGLLVLSGGARKLLILFLVLGVLNWGSFGVLRATKVNKIVDSVEANRALGSAYAAFAIRTTSFSDALERCETASDPLTCEQDAERDLLTGLTSFDSKVAGVEFPDDAGDEVTALRSASTRLRSSLNALITATSDEQYLQLVGAFQQAATGFDEAVTALSSALVRAARGI